MEVDKELFNPRRFKIAISIKKLRNEEVRFTVEDVLEVVEKLELDEKVTKDEVINVANDFVREDLLKRRTWEEYEKF